MITWRDLRQRREKQGKTCADIGEMAGVSGMFVNYVELGQRQPSVKTVRRIGRAYGLTSPEIRSLMESFGMYDQEYVDALKRVQEAQRQRYEKRINELVDQNKELTRHLAEIIGLTK